MSIEVRDTRLQDFVRAQIESGAFVNEESVIAAGLERLRQEEFEFDPGELERLIQDGLDSGPPVEARAVFEEIRSLSAARRNP